MPSAYDQVHVFRAKSRSECANCASVYDRYPEDMVRVPTRFGKRSKYPRATRKLGYLVRENPTKESPNLTWHRIIDSQKGGGTFLKEEHWMDEMGSWSRVWTIKYYELPQEIRDNIQLNRKSSA